MKPFAVVGIVVIALGTCIGLAARHDNIGALTQLDLARSVNPPALRSLTPPAIPTPQMTQSTLLLHGHPGIKSATQIGNTIVCVPQENVNTTGVVEAWAQCSGVTLEPGAGWWSSSGAPGMKVYATFNVPSGAQYAVVTVGGAVEPASTSANVMTSRIGLFNLMNSANVSSLTLTQPTGSSRLQPYT